jgi:hypothetical protein
MRAFISSCPWQLLICNRQPYLCVIRLFVDFRKCMNLRVAGTNKDGHQQLSNVADTLIGGMYGCNFGWRSLALVGDFGIGSFIPGKGFGGSD